jgi:hypothetical protein
MGGFDTERTIEKVEDSQREEIYERKMKRKGSEKMLKFAVEF